MNMHLAARSGLWSYNCAITPAFAPTGREAPTVKVPRIILFLMNSENRKNTITGAAINLTKEIA
jgi:hypothetical protein